MTYFAESKSSQNEGNYLAGRKKVLDLARVHDLEILDIGAGPLSIIAAKDYNCHVTSIDIDSDELHLWEDEAEKEGVSDRICFEEEDATNLSYCNDAFDVGVCYCALHHIPVEKRDQAVSELSRVSSERFIIADYTLEGFLEIHSREDFVAVDLNRLERFLKKIGILRVIPVENMMVYIVEKK